MARGNWILVTLMLGYGFLYLPIALLVVYSFNANRVATVWAGFSFNPYIELFQDIEILEAAWLSLRIAAIAATVGVVLGTLAALALVRFGSFRGRTLFSGMLAAPLVMPEVITGLSLLLLFVALEQAMGWPQGRGMDTIIIAHVTFAMAYAAVVVRARLISADPALEEAAQDLGARPAKVFFLITLPLIAPALVAGWLLTFTLSLDDLVIASFVSGPGSSTLPMWVFSSIRLGVSPKLNALATIILLVVAIGVAIAGWLIIRQARRSRA